MRSKFLLLLVAVAVLAAGCTKQSESVETTSATSTTSVLITTQPDSGIELVRFSDHFYGVEGLVPEGWIEIQYGVVSDGDGSTGTKLIVQQAAPGITAEELLAGLGAQLGLGDSPIPTGAVEAELLAWTLYSFETQAAIFGGQELLVDSALAESDFGAFVVALIVPPDEYDALHEAVFLPAVQAFAPPPQLPAPEPSAPYLDASTPVDERVEDLLSRMSLAEKVGQMTQVEKNSIQPEHITLVGIGSLLSGGGGAPDENTPAAWAEMVDGFQALSMNTRLGIPLIYGVDAVHGHNNVRGATIFPHNVGLGAANDAELMRQIGQITAVEVAATGIHWNFAPTVAVPQDIRWGRTYEGYGEAPDLVVPLATAYLEGLQGEDLSDRTTVLATAKHYVGDGGTTWGSATTGALIDQGVTQIDEAELRKTHLPPYVEAIKRGAMSVMTSFSSWNDTRMHAHRYLVTDVLKGELGFEGFVISDWAAIDQISDDYYEAVVAAFNAGIDMNMVPYDYLRFIWMLQRAVDNGDVPIERIDDAVRRILRVKFELGLFETPYSDSSLLERVGSDEHRAVAREAAGKSAVLLKNDGDVLPIGEDVNLIFVGGQAADDIGIQSGGWTIEWQGKEGAITPGTTILEGIQASVVGDAEILFDKFGNLDRIDRDDGAEPDLCIGVVGERPYAEGEGDSADLALPSRDLAVLENLGERCDRLVVVLISGRPLLIADQLDGADAFVAAWLPGTEGQGVADVLFGIRPFQGKLPYTWPRSIDQVPLEALTEGEGESLFPFGFGLES